MTVTLHATSDELASTAVVDEERGGRLRQITVTAGSRSVDLLAAVDGDAQAWSSGWGSFPMAPWAGRLRQGRLDVLGTITHLDLNHDDGSGTGGGPIHPPVPGDGPDGPASRHAIHGTVFDRAWIIDRIDDTSMEMHCRIDTALGWPYPGVARQHITLHPTSIELHLAVEADGDSVFPAAVGWHPWFAKPERLELAPLAMYERDRHGMPTGRLVVPTDPPWDDCFVNLAPVTLRYERQIADSVTVDSDCDHLVLYDKPAHATCVEPQSGPPDALTIRPELVTAGSPIRRTMTIDW